MCEFRGIVDFNAPFETGGECIVSEQFRSLLRRRLVCFQSRMPQLSTPDKRAAQSIGVRLRNLLKLPKAHKWVCYEWFYSNLDA